MRLSTYDNERKDGKGQFFSRGPTSLTQSHLRTARLTIGPKETETLAGADAQAQLLHSSLLE